MRNPKLQGFSCLACLGGDLKPLLPRVMLRHQMHTLSVQRTNRKRSMFHLLMSSAQRVLEMERMVEIGLGVVQDFHLRVWIWMLFHPKSTMGKSQRPKHHHHCPHPVRVWSQRHPKWYSNPLRHCHRPKHRPVLVPPSKTYTPEALTGSILVEFS